MQGAYRGCTLAGVTIHNRIKEAREAKGLNQSEVARHMKVFPQTVQQWESGKTAPRRGRLLALASFLGVTPEWLLFGKGGTNHVAKPLVLVIPNKTDAKSKVDPDKKLRAYRLVDQAVYETKVALTPEEKESIVNLVVELLDTKSEIGTVKVLLRVIK